MKPTRIAALALFVFLLAQAGIGIGVAEEQTGSVWLSALDEEKVRRTGNWGESRFRYAAATSLQTSEGRAALELSFEGTGIAVRFGGHQVPAYGSPNLGNVAVSIDDGEPVIIRPREAVREIVLVRGLTAGKHRLRIEHDNQGGNTGCRIEGFRIWQEPRGELGFTVNGERQAFMVDVRANLLRKGALVQSTLVRNWMTGQCALAGLVPGEGFALELVASGWKPVRIEDIRITAGQETKLPAIHLQRQESTEIRGFRFPALNRPAIRKPGQPFRARFLAYQAAIDGITLTRQIGPAIISRKLAFEEDESKAYYYDREVVARLPDDMPPGLYDLNVQITGGRRTGFCRSPRSVHVVGKFPEDPVLVTFGHLDTSGQYQAEYLGRIADMANLIGADLVLNSNAVNPAYISGALSRLQIPYLVNFGNHQFFGHEQWYGDPVNRVDFGPGISILNYGHPWHHGIDLADALLAQRPDATIKIINAFEQNAPLEFLDRHRVSLIHDAHGTGGRVMNMGATPTRRVGKTNAVSFRVIRYRDGRVESCTYNGHETKPFPFERDEEPPLSVRFSAPNDGTRDALTATIGNRYLDPFPNGRVVFVMPQGKYQATLGRIESQISSDDGTFTVVTVRLDIPASGSVEVAIARE